MFNIYELKRIRDIAIDILDNIQMTDGRGLTRSTINRLLDEREILEDELKKILDNH
jgi:hypothetical protein